MLLSSDWTTYSLCTNFWTYSLCCHFELSSFDLPLVTLVKFLNTCFFSQDLNMDYAGLVPTKIDSDFCWLNSGVTFKSKFEFIKLLSNLEMNLEIQTQLVLLIGNLKQRLEQGNLSNSKSIYIKSPVLLKCKNNLIKFPAPCVSTCCTSNQVKPEWTFQTWDTLHLYNHLRFEAPSLQVKMTKRLDLGSTAPEPETNEIHFTNIDTPYEPELDDEIC